MFPILIGTSGYDHPELKGSFYPPKLRETGSVLKSFRRIVEPGWGILKINFQFDFFGLDKKFSKNTTFYGHNFSNYRNNSHYCIKKS